MNAGPALLTLERDGEGDTIRSYTHGVSLISMLSGGGQHYFHTDLLGSVANVSSADGTKEWTYAYEAYGTSRTTTQDDGGAPANPIRFAGEYRDGSGLSNLRSRSYDPASGRFTSQQAVPTALAAPTSSSYAYANNSPTGTVSSNGIGTSPAGEGCGPGITRCSLERLANSPCPAPLAPYMGLPGFKPFWLAGYYSVCEGLRGMLREQSNGSPEGERGRPRCGGRETAIGAGAIVVGAGVLVFGLVPSVLARGGTWATADLLSQIGGPGLKFVGDVGKGVFSGSSIAYGIYCLAR